MNKETIIDSLEFGSMHFPAELQTDHFPIIPGMLTSVLMDIDGTMIDTRSAFYVSLNEALRKHGLPETDERSLFGMSVDQALAALGIPDTSEIKRDWEVRFGELSEAAGFYPNIVEMAAYLHSQGIRIILITSRSHSTADPVCTSSEVSPYITGCIAAEDTFEHKPSPAPLLKAMALYDVDPRRTAYIGDTAMDAQAALRAGIPFIYAGWNGCSEPDYPVILHDPMEIAQIM